MGSFAIIALTVALLATPFASAQYGARVTTPILQRGVSAAGGTQWKLSDVQLAEIRGIYLNTGRSTPLSAVFASDNNTLPDCSRDNNNLLQYNGLEYGAGIYYGLIGTAPYINWEFFSAQRSVFTPNVTYNGSFIVVNRMGVPSCTHFQPFIDLTTGELKVESLAITQWAANATNATAPPVRTSLNCEIVGNELPGCYTGAIATSAGSGTTLAPTVAVSSIVAPAPRPSGSIRTVTRNVYTCQQGECLRLSPKYSGTTPAYGCST